VRNRQIYGDRALAEIIIQQCGILVPELELKWDMLRPTPGTFDFSGADSLYDFAKLHQILLRGHTLVWYAALPQWFATTANSANAETLLRTHISTVVGRYAGKMQSWDVVNEAVEISDGRPDNLRKSPWLQLLGPDYIEMAFRAAHQADPKVPLVYNENFLEPENEASEQKRRVVLNLLTDLKKKGVPIHALGIQSHLYAETYATGPKFKRFLAAISDLGLDILVTEMDVRDKNLPSDIQIRDRKVADQYYNYLSFLLQFKAVKTVLTWGLSDRYTWLSQGSARPDGLPVRPLPYGADYQPAPAWDAIHRAFEEASPR
jgi:endo-1,4-beta-xylanase